MTWNAYFVDARSVQETALLIEIQITSSSGHIFLRGLLGEIRMLPVPHLSQQWASFLSVNPLLCLGSALHLLRRTAMSHLALSPGSVPCVVKICGSFSLSRLPLDSFLFTAHSLPWRGRICCCLALNLVYDTFKQWIWPEWLLMLSHKQPCSFHLVILDGEAT